MASLKPRKRGEQSFKELDAEMHKNFSMKMGQLKRLKKDIHEDDEDSGVVFISHIPHGFYEPQMKKFFSQFGNIKRLRLSRSKKSGRSKGYAYIEFEFSEVAKVVAETMHNYLMYQKLLKCWYVPKDKLHPDTFRGCFRQFKKPKSREISAARNNSILTKGKDHMVKTSMRRVNSLKKKQEQLDKLGIDFKIDTLESKLEQMKESKSVSVPKDKLATSKSKKTLERTHENLDYPPDKIEKVQKSAKKSQKTIISDKAKNTSKEKDIESPSKLQKLKKIEKTIEKATPVQKEKASSKKKILKGKGEVKSAKVALKSKARSKARKSL